MDKLTKGSRITGDDRSVLGASLAERYQAGESIRALAEDIGRSFGFVHGVITETGVPLRGRGGATRGRSARKDGAAVGSARVTAAGASTARTAAATAGRPRTTGKKVEGKKVEDKKADGKKADGKKADGKKADGKKADSKKSRDGGKKTRR